MSEKFYFKYMGFLFILQYVYILKRIISFFTAIFYCTVMNFKRTELPSYSEHLCKLTSVLSLYFEFYIAQKCSKGLVE